MHPKNLKLKKLVIAALFAAVIFTVTTYFPRIPTGVGGYVHLGDGFIFIVAALLPTPYALCAAAIGSGLADLFAGAPIFIPATVLIKALSALCFTSKKPKMLCLHNFAALGASAVITASGYYLYESTVVSGNFLAPLVEIIPNIFQCGAGAVIFVVFGIIYDKSPSLRKFITM